MLPGERSLRAVVSGPPPAEWRPGDSGGCGRGSGRSRRSALPSRAPPSNSSRQHVRSGRRAARQNPPALFGYWVGMGSGAVAVAEHRGRAARERGGAAQAVGDDVRTGVDTEVLVDGDGPDLSIRAAGDEREGGARQTVKGLPAQGQSLGDLLFHDLSSPW